MNKAPITLKDSFKTYTYDQDKVCTPTETIERFKNRLKEVNLDILKEIRRIDNGRLDIPVYFSVCGKDAHAAIGNKKQMGKGSTPEQSQASACMELAERFSFFTFKKNPANFITDTYANLKAQALPLLPLEQMLQSVHDTTTSAETLEKLIADIPIQWTWATNITNNTEVLIPFTWFYAINEFNGPSAGNTYEEAIIQGICEIVERHVCSIISHNRQKTPVIEIATIKDPVARQLIAKFTKNGITLYLNDFTLDTGIPTIGAMAIDQSTFPELSEIVFTAGTTPNPEKALIRALTEVAQLAGDFNTKANYVASGLPKPLSLQEADYIIESDTKVCIDTLPDLNDNNLKVEIKRCLAALKRINMEVYLINTMHPELKIPAIYTIVPGAHFRERSMIRNAGLFAAKIIAEQISDPIEQISRFIEMKKILPKAYYLEFYLGRSLANLGRHDDAVLRLQTALTLNPEEEDIPYIYSYMGECLKDMGKYDDAIITLKQGIAHDNERPDLHNLLGFCHFKLSNFEAAVEHFTKTVELAPSSAIDYANLGVNYQKLGNKEEAIKNFEIALALDASIEFARQGLEKLSATS